MNRARLIARSSVDIADVTHFSRSEILPKQTTIICSLPETVGPEPSPIGVEHDKRTSGSEHAR
jgi:hypothetical protein